MSSLNPLKLDIAIARYGHTAALKDGQVRIDGVEPNFIEVNPIIAAFRRMVRSVEFDVCEMAPATYMIARSFGAPFKALPVFIMRRFHHGGFVVHPDSGIAEPKDIEGKKVGVRAYSVSTGIWTRGIFQNEYGVDLRKVTWMIDDEEHVKELKLPPNVQSVAEGKSLVAMMATGELQAAFSGPAGIGRAGAPKDGWDGANLPQIAYPEIFKDPLACEKDWYKKTGIYPTHGLIVVKDSLLAQYPWLGQSLYDAFLESKEMYLTQLRAGHCQAPIDKDYLTVSKIVGDPLPYGVKNNLPAINALIDYCYQQSLIPKRYAVEDMFVSL
jgi:4,5-dihydroxyphthalate decarboxylase